VRSKADTSHFNLPHGTNKATTKKWKTGKLKSKKTNMLRSIGKQFGKSIMVSPEEEKEGYGGEGLQKMKFLKPGMKE